MASPQRPEVTTAERQRPMPSMEPAVVNPPATQEQLQSMDDRARAAIGGTAAVRRPAEPEADPQAAVAESPAAGPRPPAPQPKPNRFAPPEEIPWEYTPPERQQIKNTNIPLTVGLLLSIVAAFLVFLISLAGGAAGEDPIMPSFWRGLGALAVFMTLSFAASWFMPAPAERRHLLDQLDAQDRLMEERYGRPKQAPDPAPEPAPQEPEDKGASVDITLSDEELEQEEELEELEADEYEEAFEDDEDDLVTAAEHANG